MLSSMALEPRHLQRNKTVFVKHTGAKSTAHGFWNRKGDKKDGAQKAQTKDFRGVPLLESFHIHKIKTKLNIRAKITHRFSLSRRLLPGLPVSCWALAARVLVPVGSRLLLLTPLWTLAVPSGPFPSELKKEAMELCEGCPSSKPSGTEPVFSALAGGPRALESPEAVPEGLPAVFERAPPCADSAHQPCRACSSPALSGHSRRL